MLVALNEVFVGEALEALAFFALVAIPTVAAVCDRRLFVV